MDREITETAAANRILQTHGLGRKRYSNPAEALKAIVAVQTQYPASVGPALAARANGVTERWLRSALSKHKIVLKGWNLRVTLHASLAEDHMLLLRALHTWTGRRYADWMRRAHGISDEQLEELHGQVMEALERRPLGRRDLHDRVPFYKGLGNVGWGADMMGLALAGKVVLSHQAAAKTEFARLDTWAPHVTEHAAGQIEALEQVVYRYFATYGPATFADFVYWTGSRVSHAKEAWERAKPALTPVNIAGRKEEFYVYRDPPEWSEASVSPLRLLPKFDPLLMGRKDKSLFLPDALKGRVFRPAGQVEATVLADLKVRGTWRTARKGECLEFTIDPFEKFNQRWMDQLEREAQRAAASLGFKKFSIT